MARKRPRASPGGEAVTAIGSSQPIVVTDEECGR